MTLRILPKLPPTDQPVLDQAGHFTLPWREYLIQLDYQARRTLIGSTTVAGLPSAATMGPGARAFVTDANATTFHATVAAGGSNKVPVVSDGTNWLIG